MDTPPPGTSATGSTPPPPPFGSPRPRQLRRRPDHGHIAGVCAGVAEYFNVDPVIVRIAAVVLAFSGPGVFAYILAWIFVPEAGPSSSDPFARPPSDRRDRGTQVSGIVLLAVSVSILWGEWWSPTRSWTLPLGLMALGAWLLLRRDGADGADGRPIGARPAAMSTVDEGAGGGAILPPWDSGASGIGPPPEATEATEAVTAAARRRRILAPLVMGALLLWTGIAFLADVSLESGLAIALCIVGVGFVLGAFVGGTWGLIVPAVAIGGALIVASVADIPLSGPIGDRSWVPRTASEVENRYELSIGEGTVDLTALALGAGDHLAVEASVGIGHLIIEVPDGVALDITADVAAGETVLLGYPSSGVGVSSERSFGGGSGTGSIELDLQVGLGQIEVRRQGPDGALTTPGTTTTLG